MESGGWPYPHETGRRSSDIVSRVNSLYSVCSPFPFDILFTEPVIVQCMKQFMCAVCACLVLVVHNG